MAPTLVIPGRRLKEIRITPTNNRILVRDQDLNRRTILNFRVKSKQRFLAVFRIGKVCVSPLCWEELITNVRGRGAVGMGRSFFPSISCYRIYLFSEQELWGAQGIMFRTISSWRACNFFLQQELWGPQIRQLKQSHSERSEYPGSEWEV